MELVKNIFFNTDRLIAGNSVKISYTGLFFQNESKKAFIRYGFGKDWENLVETEMEKTELGFQIEIELLDKGSFNFCIRNENNEWDNNEGENYTFEIESPETSLVVVNNGNSIRRLRKTYIWSKKVKLAIYKILTYIPRLITGNYKKKLNNNN